MNTIINAHLLSLKLSPAQRHENLTIVPIVGPAGKGPEYLTLYRASAEKLIEIQEVSAGGSVPELRVVNHADLPVLLLDGDELVGAKQNRVANTSILIPAHQEMVIPVSCTERGRWTDRASSSFAPGDHLHTASLRWTKLKGVSDSLLTDASFCSRQSDVWFRVSRLSDRAGIHSPTCAMHDVFEGRKQELDRYVKAFPLVEGQTGIIAVLNGRVVGMDVLSRAEAYSDIHVRLVRGYALEAQIGDRTQKDESADPIALARAFLEQAEELDDRPYESVGLGWDHRITGTLADGSALVHKNTVIHLCLFARADSESGDPHWQGPVY